MDKPTAHTFGKDEKLCSHKAIDELFEGGHLSLSAYPIRAVLMRSDCTSTRVLMSVPKRLFKRAVHRNRVKRQLREAYRLNKTLLDPQEGMNIAFLWLSKELFPTHVVSEKMHNLLRRIHESNL